MEIFSQRTLSPSTVVSTEGSLSISATTARLGSAATAKGTSTKTTILILCRAYSDLMSRIFSWYNWKLSPSTETDKRFTMLATEPLRPRSDTKCSSCREKACKPSKTLAQGFYSWSTRENCAILKRKWKYTKTLLITKSLISNRGLPSR